MLLPSLVNTGKYICIYRGTYPSQPPASVTSTGTPNGAKNDRQTTVTLSDNPSETIIGDDTHQIWRAL